MKKSIVIGGLGILLLSAIGVSISDDDRWEKHAGSWLADHEEADDRHSEWWGNEGRDVAPVRSGPYREECGACHLAYQPGLLPARSWERLMSSLDQHYGDNAALPEPQVSAIREYLVRNAADGAESRYSRGLRGSLNKQAVPERITDTPYFRRQHHEIPLRLVQDNPQVRSFANCQVCHRHADRGSYDEHGVRIPGIGAWED